MDSSIVSLAPASPGQDLVTYTINVAAHEAGHASDSMHQYDFDAAQPGSELHPDPAEQGTTMEHGVDPETLSNEIREFSVEDSEQLRERLNRE